MYRSLLCCTKPGKTQEIKAGNRTSASSTQSGHFEVSFSLLESDNPLSWKETAFPDVVVVVLLDIPRKNQTTSFAESFPLIRKRRNNHHRLSIPHTHTKPTGLPLFGFPGTLFSINPSYFFPFSLQRKDFKSFIKLGQKHPFFRTENRRSWTPQTIFIWIDFIICRTESHPHINHPPPRTKLGDAAWESEEKIDILVSAKQKKLRRTFFLLLTLTRAFFLLVRVCVCVYHFRPAASVCAKRCR